MVVGDYLYVKTTEGPFLETYIQVLTLPDYQRTVGVRLAEPAVLHPQPVLHAPRLEFDSVCVEHVLS